MTEFSIVVFININIISKNFVNIIIVIFLFISRYVFFNFVIFIIIIYWSKNSLIAY